MLKRLSKSGFLLQFILFLALGTLFWFPAFMHPKPASMIESAGPLYRMIAGWLGGDASFSVILAAVLLVAEAFALHALFSSHDLIPRDSFIDAIIFLICMSWNPELLYLNPAITAGIFILFALFMMMRMYGRTEPFQEILSASLSIAVASLIFQPASWFFIGLWIGLLTYRITSWREWVISLIGMALPLIYMVSIYYLQGTLNENWVFLIAPFQEISIDIAPFSSGEISFLAAALFMLFYASAATLNSVSDKLISIRRKTWIITDFSLAGLFSILVAHSAMKIGQLLLMAPLAFFLTYAAISIKKSRFNNFIIVIFLLFVIVIHYIL
ncbi:MAG TPA: hypothetical protein PLJ84_00035 [Bacteroidales bacterium]|nr:hypothetical protein [Bacteroidales bacterium]HPT00957.1 hypothetical protein [Bacteroidales bacterium]